MVPEKIHSIPTEGIGFSSGRGGGGGSICLIFQWEGGVHHREIFPKGPLIVTPKRVTEKKNQKKQKKIYHDNSFAKIQNKTKLKELTKHKD